MRLLIQLKIEIGLNVVPIDDTVWRHQVSNMQIGLNLNILM